jgi:hypothetical protein
VKRKYFYAPVDLRRDGFIEADVIRWKEGIYERKGPRQGCVVRIGDRLVTAEVLGEVDEEGWVYLLIRSSEILKLKDGKKPHMWMLKKESETKRKSSTLQCGNLERMLWSEESARDVIASQFIGNRKRQKRLRNGDSEER